MITATIFEAKTNLSQLVKRAQKGETVLITFGRAKEPVVRLEPVQPVRKKRLGVLATPGFVLGKGFFEPLDDDEIADDRGL
jgi:antitoxin (DNA-binding transcriptional repressor) of toxin-antitoxin stability system